MPPLFPLTLALYAVACTLYIVAVSQPQLAGAARMARRCLALAFGGQAIDIAWLCLHGQHPGSSGREAIFFASWLMIGAFPILTFRQPIPLLGALLVPVAMIMDLVARVTPSGLPAAAMASPGHRALGTLHILSATLGTALFGVAAAASIVYLRSERRLKDHKPATAGAPVRPALSTLDSWNRLSIGFGFLSFTVALVTGTVWLILSPRVGGPREAAGLWDTVLLLVGQPQYMLSLLTWLLYAGLLGARVAFGLRGRRAAAVTLAGFAAALGVLILYLLRDVRVLHL
jgi:ABC-type uncharacterized transport system permease subunit